MRWLDGIMESVDMNLCKPQKSVIDRVMDKIMLYLMKDYDMIFYVYFKWMKHNLKRKKFLEKKEWYF